MDSTEQAFDEIVSQLNTPSAPRRIATILRNDAARALHTAGEFLLYLLALAIVAGLVGALAMVARLGWEIAGGVGW